MPLVWPLAYRIWGEPQFLFSASPHIRRRSRFTGVSPFYEINSDN